MQIVELGKALAGYRLDRCKAAHWRNLNTLVGNGAIPFDRSGITALAIVTDFICCGDFAGTDGSLDVAFTITGTEPLFKGGFIGAIGFRQVRSVTTAVD